MVSHCADCFEGVSDPSKVRIMVRPFKAPDSTARSFAPNFEEHSFEHPNQRGVVVWCSNGRHSSSKRFIQKDDVDEGGRGVFKFRARMEKVPWRCGESPVIYWAFKGKDDPLGREA